jgi:exopolysaccharide biosynthesis polyprenyl glycosylphosphotransferase
MRSSIPKTIAQKYFPYIDVACIFFAFCISYAMLPYLVILLSPHPESHVPSMRAFSWILIFFVPLWFILMKLEGAYERFLEWSYLTIIGKMAKITILSFAFSTLSMFLLKELDVSRLFMSALSACSFSFMTFLRIVFRLTLERARKTGALTEPAVLIGDGANIERFVKDILPKESERLLKVVGYVNTGMESDTHCVPQLGNINDLKTILNNTPVAQSILILTDRNSDKFSEVLSVCEQTGTSLRIVNWYLFDKEVCYTYACRSDFFAGFPSSYFTEVNWSVEKEIAKRIFDLFFSTIALLILSPLFGLIAAVIKLSSPGPVFYRRQLIGQYGKPFVVLKFRTMVENAHQLLENNSSLLAEYQKSLKIENDPRVTGIGKILRKTSLDELPQFINVFKGEMSIVGPRMLGDIEWNKYGEAKAKVLSVKPGITGLWQVSGRHDVTFEERIRYDLLYISDWNMVMDLRIILKTIPALFNMRGAH